MNNFKAVIFDMDGLMFDTERLIKKLWMQSCKEFDINVSEEILNKIIGLMQVAGTGIALVVITLLGIKYMLASPSEKADTKKMIMPILIGCILLFAAVNIVSTILDLVGVLE